MATYQELLGLRYDKNITEKVLIACIIAANAISAESPNTANHAARLVWAKTALTNPESVREQMVLCLLAQSSVFDVATILAADDASVLAAVSNSVNLFAA